MKKIISVILVLCIAASFSLTLIPGDSVTVTGCTTNLSLTGNVLSCAAQSATSTATRTATSAPATNTPTRTPTNTPTYIPVILKGLAIVGDSTQDEYQAPENNRPGYNWVEWLVRARALPVGTWGSWGGSRRTGYEFNWARSGAVAYNARYDQAPGVVQQINAGRVSHVLVQIGINDFNTDFDNDGIPLAGEIYYNTVPDWQAQLSYVAGLIVQTANTLNAAAPGRVIVAGTQDYTALGLVPLPAASALTDPAGKARIVAAFAYLNSTVASGVGGMYWDFNAAMSAELAPRWSGTDYIVINGQAVSVKNRGSGRLNAFINDAYMHPGTSLSGLFAKLYIQQLNLRFGTDILPLTDVQIMTEL